MAIGSGGNVGGADFEITASEGSPSVQDVLKKIHDEVRRQVQDVGKLTKAYADLANALGDVELPEGLDPDTFGEIADQIDEAKNSTKALNDEQAKGAGTLRAHQEARRKANTETVQAVRDERDAAKGVATELVNAAKAQRDLTKGAKEFTDSPGGLIPGAPGGDFTKNFGGITTVAKEIQALNNEAKLLFKTFGEGSPVIASRIGEISSRLTVLHTAAGTTFQGFNAGAKKAAAEGTFFQRAVAGMNERLQRLGLNVSGVSVLLGAGFAGGLAGVIKILLDAGQALGAFVARLQDVQRETRLTFGSEVAAEIESFAERTATSLGRTESEMLGLVNNFAALGRQLELPDEGLDDFSIALADAAARLERSLPGFKNLEEVQKAITAAVKGDEAALRSLGVTQEEQVAKSLELFGKLPDILTDSEKGMVNLKLVTDEAATSFENAGRLSSSFLDDIKNKAEGIAEIIGDFFNFDQNEIADGLNTVVSALSGVSDAAGRISKTAFEKVFSNDIDVLTGQIGKLSDTQIEALQKQASEAIILTDENADFQKILIGLLEEELRLRGELTGQTQSQADAVDAIAEANRRNEAEFLASAKLQQQAIDLIRTRNRAEEDGARRIREALVSRGRAYEDAARRERDVRLRIKREAEDANRDIAEAEIDLQRAREDRDRELDKTLTDHNRKRSDIRREHLRNLQDFDREEKELRKKNLEAVLSANLALGQALRKGDFDAERAARLALSRAQSEARTSVKDFTLEKERELQDFRRDAAREQEDRVRDLNDLEIESNREIFDAQRELEEAFRDRQRAFEDAVNALHDLEVENARALTDANKQVESAKRDAARALEDANRAIERFAKGIGFTVEKLDEMLDRLERLQNAIIAIQQNPFDFSLPFSPGFVPPGGQHGFRNFPGGLALVGEDGPEIAYLPRGTDLFSNPESRRLLEALSGRGSPSITINEVAGDKEATAFAVLARLFQGSN